MNAADANLSFPVLGFSPDREIWGFQDLDTLTSCGPKTLKDNMQVGMELIDAEGRRWRVLSIRRTGRAQPLIVWMVGALMTACPQSRIEQELEPLEPVPFAEVRARTCASLEAFPEDHGAYEGLEHILESLLQKVRSAESTGEILELLGLDSFKAY